MVYVWGKSITIPGTLGDIAYTQAKDPAPTVANENELFELVLDNGPSKTDTLQGADDVTIYLEQGEGNDTVPSTLQIPVHQYEVLCIGNLTWSMLQAIRGVAVSGSAVHISFLLWSHPSTAIIVEQVPENIVVTRRVAIVQGAIKGQSQ